MCERNTVCCCCLLVRLLALKKEEFPPKLICRNAVDSISVKICKLCNCSFCEDTDRSWLIMMLYTASSNVIYVASDLWLYFLLSKFLFTCVKQVHKYWKKSKTLIFSWSLLQALQYQYQGTYWYKWYDGMHCLPGDCGRLWAVKFLYWSYSSILVNSIQFNFFACLLPTICHRGKVRSTAGRLSTWYWGRRPRDCVLVPKYCTT
jgi:hypothetical protein